MPETPSRSIAVYGALRSGTTLLRLMLDGHPGLACPGETDFLVDALAPGAGPDTPYDIARLERGRIYRAHAKLHADRPLERPTPNDLIDRIAMDRIGVLMLHRRLGRLLDLYPEMRVVHMLRDPRDVARSSIPMGWAGTVWHGVRHWIDTETEWQAVAPRLSPGQSLCIRYEELIGAPEETLRRICDFCDLPWDPAMLSYHMGSSYSAPDPRLISQWQSKLTPREIALVEYRVGDLLAASGYPPSGHPVVPPGRGERLRLDLVNKARIWRQRFRRYGLRDPLIVAMSYKLKLPGLPALAARAQRRIDDKEIRYLQ